MTVNGERKVIALRGCGELHGYLVSADEKTAKSSGPQRRDVAGRPLSPVKTCPSRDPNTLGRVSRSRHSRKRSRAGLHLAERHED